MNIHKAILIKPADNLQVIVWDRPCPHYKGYINLWNKSYKTYDVHTDYLDRIKNIAICLIEGTFSPILSYRLIGGIEIDPNLIEIVNGFATLKDKPVESEDDLWDEIIRIIYSVSANDRINVLKQKYTPKRK